MRKHVQKEPREKKVVPGDKQRQAKRRLVAAITRYKQTNLYPATSSGYSIPVRYMLGGKEIFEENFK
jgi:hypothetical protein